MAVESEEGTGSCFTVWLPIRPPGDVAAPITSAAEPKTAEPAGVRTALVVEHDAKSADLIRVQLSAEGFTVLHAASAEEALVIAAQQPLSLITLDVMLPNVDGWELLSRIKQTPDLRRIPVVIISIAADRNRGFLLGASAVMQKPISRQELSESLAELGLSPSASGQPLKALVVDDNLQALDLVELRFQDLGRSVMRASGGREGDRHCAPGTAADGVLDLMMPEVNGFTTWCRALSEENPSTASHSNPGRHGRTNRRC